MAEGVSDSEVQAVKPQPKRRRILDPSTIVPVPVYSSKVSSSLQLKPRTPIFTIKESTDNTSDEALWSGVSSQCARVSLSESEEDEAEHVEKRTEPEAPHRNSPSPPESPVIKHSKQFLQKMSEIDRKLQAVNSHMSPDPPSTRKRHRRRSPPPEEDDVVLINPDSPDQLFPQSSSEREIPLKVRCRADIYKIRVLSTTPLSDVVTQLSVILKVPPPRLLLMRKEAELSSDATVGELGLGIADIIECDVMAAEEESNSVTVRLQSKDKNSTQDFSLDRDAPLGSIFTQYISKMAAKERRKVRFHFDGCKVTDRQTPAQLDMEDGDIIEVWI